MICAMPGSIRCLFLKPAMPLEHSVLFLLHNQETSVTMDTDRCRTCHVELLNPKQ